MGGYLRGRAGRRRVYPQHTQRRDNHQPGIRLAGYRDTVGGSGSPQGCQEFLLNEPPAVADDYEIIAEDSGSHSFEVLSNDTDPDGDSLQIVEIALDDPTLGVAGISADGRAVEFEPASDAHGVTNRQL